MRRSELKPSRRPMLQPPQTRAIRNVDLALVGSGAGPPAIRLVGPVTVPLSLLVRVIGAGVLGVAVIQIAVNGGPYGTPQVALGSVPLGAANLVLAAGPYVGDEAYSLRVPG